MPITIANRTVYTSASVSSGSFTIPSTVSGNLLAVFVSTMGIGTANYPGTPRTALVISDNAGDVFTQVPWYSIAGAGATNYGTVAYATAHANDVAPAGAMTAFPSPGWESGTSAAAAFVGNIDAWYTTTSGGSTTITWSVSPSAVQLVFWVYELTGASNWSLATYAVTTGGMSSEPYVGPSLTSAMTDNVYFSLIGALGSNTFAGFQPGGTVSGPWVLDATSTDRGALSYIADSSGTQQATFDSAAGQAWFVSHGVAFSGIPSPLVTVFGGNFQDASGNPLANGKLTMRLLQDIRIGSVSICAGRLTTLALDTTGNISPSPGSKLWGPASYQVIAYTPQGLAAWSGTIIVPDVASFSFTP